MLRLGLQAFTGAQLNIPCTRLFPALNTLTATHFRFIKRILVITLGVLASHKVPNQPNLI